MNKYFIGTKEKGNLFKDGRTYKSKKTAKIALERVKDCITDEIEIIEISVKTEEDLIKENNELKQALSEICNILNEKKVDRGMICTIEKIANEAKEKWESKK